MAFHDVIGQDRAIALLRRLNGGSLIFHGPEGTGRRLAALSLAQAFNCDVEPGVGCGRCRTCTRIATVERGKIEEGDHKGDARETTQHPDVRIVVPGKEEIRIDEIRAIRRQAAARPFEGRMSVFIVDPAERMTTEAANALLKTLEEPPPSSCLILIAGDPEALLPTVRSRCRLVPFVPVAEDVVARHLEARGMPAGDARIVARLSGGRPGRAMGFDLDAYRAARGAVLDVVGRLIERRPRAHVVKDAETLGSRDDDAVVAASLEILETVLRDAMVLLAGSAAIVNQDVEPRIAAIGRAMGDRLPGGLGRIGEARRDLASHVNRQLLLEVMLLDLAA